MCSHLVYTTIWLERKNQFINKKKRKETNLINLFFIILVYSFNSRHRAHALAFIFFSIR